MRLIKTNGKPLSSQQLTLTNGLLIKWNNQLELKRKSNDVDYYLHRNEIHAFYVRYEKKILEINNRVIEIRKKYFEMDAEGKPVFEEVQPPLKPQVKVKEGLTREGYQVEINALMGEEV